MATSQQMQSRKRRLWVLASVGYLVAMILGCCSACTTNSCNSSYQSTANCAIGGSGSSTAAVSPSGSESGASPSSTSMASASAIPGSSSGTDTPTASSSPKVYYNVPVQPLCDDEQCGGDLQVGDTTFSYNDSAAANDYPRYLEYQAFQNAATSCSELTVQFSGDSWRLMRKSL